MTVQAKMITGLIDELAPPVLAETWDNSGWQVGDPAALVDRVLVTLDVDERVAEEAINDHVQLIISHHPLILKGVKNIRLDTVFGRLVSRLLNAGTGVYAAHTNLDIAPGGINDVLAGKMGFKDMQVLQVTEKGKYFKLVVFVPPLYLEGVMEALRGQGAGWIGNYSDCTFQLKGTGTFRPGPGTDPFTGRQGELEKVEEIRLETIVPAARVEKTVAAMIEAHPYEEVAYDLYPLALEGPEKGLGRVGNLESPLSLGEFAQAVKNVLGIASVRYGGQGEEIISRVAVCGGSGAELWPAARAQGAQVLVTGDVKYHTAQDILAAGMGFVDAGHYGTEKIVIEFLGDYLEERLKEKGLDVEVLRSRAGSDPFQTV